jgi:hypothetical protein
MIVSVTSIKLKSVWLYFRLTYLAMFIVKQTKSQKGFFKMKNRGFGKLHFTLSAWKSSEDMKNFVHSGAHSDAMKRSRELADELRFYSFETEQMPSWAEAKKLLMTKGRILKTRS